METQILSRQGLKEIHAIACPNWKEVLEHYGSRNLLENYVELTQNEVDKMFAACTQEQLPIVSKYLKQDDGSVDVTEFTVSGKGFCDDNFYVIPYSLLNYFYKTISNIDEKIWSHNYNKYFDNDIINYMIDGEYYSHEIKFYQLNRIEIL